jgi:hypothetical protein
MPILGRYEVLNELHAGSAVSVSRAKLADGKAANFVVKWLHPRNIDAEALRSQVDAFLERARLQQRVGASPNTRHWAPIRYLGKLPIGAFYVTDYFPASADNWIADPAPVSAAALGLLVSSVVEGLRELRGAANRAHGRLKATNVLIGRSKSGDTRIVLTDPGSAAEAQRVGENGDLHALGELIHLLVTRRLPAPEDQGSVAPDEGWDRLGRNGEAWRQLCSDLLTPQAEPTEGHLEELAGVVEGFNKRHKRNLGKWGIRAAIAATLLVVTATVLDYAAQRSFCRSRADWLDAFAAAIADPARAQRYQGDPALRQAMQDTAEAERGAPPSGYGLFDLRPWNFPELRARLAAVHRVREDLSPAQWSVAAGLLAAQHDFESHGWTQSASFVAGKLAQLTSRPGPDLATTVDQLPVFAATIDAQRPPLEKRWSDLDDASRKLENSGDAYLATFGALLRRSAADALRLGDSGFEGVASVADDDVLADQLVAALKAGYPKNIDAQRFFDDVTSRMNLAKLGLLDARHWIDREPQYVHQDDQTGPVVAELERNLRQNLQKVAAANPAAADLVSAEGERQSIQRLMDDFAQAHFIVKDFNDGTFAAQRGQIDARIAALLVHVRVDDPKPWLKALPTVATRSDVINAYWEDWKHVLETNTAEMERRGDIFHKFKKQTERLQTALISLDADFPAPPTDLSAPFAAAARQQRESELGRILADLDPSDPAPWMTNKNTLIDDYRQWCTNLTALGKQFPLRSELLTLSDEPDKAWSANQPKFWNDPMIRGLVAKDLDRLKQLRALRDLGRSDLIDAATESTNPEISFAAWQLLGGPAVYPAWPTQSGELETEADLRGKLATMVAAIKNPATRSGPLAALAQQREVRWRRFVEAARNDVMLEQALSLTAAFGNEAQLIPALPPAAQFDVALYRSRQLTDRADEKTTAATVAELEHAAHLLPPAAGLQPLLDRLARLATKEPFADHNPGDRFNLNLPGLPKPFVFQRVEPEGARPFYLCTTAVSFGQFAGVIGSLNAWDQAAAFPWGADPNKRDTRRGPRVWEWVQRPSLQMVTPLLWFFPEDDNDFAPIFRIDRFNRTAVSDDVGGNPSPDHPMQQIPAEAALYYAGLCGCRLPTADEWRSAYAIFERTVPAERWNLRDQTWNDQLQYAAASTGPNVRWPDEGIFIPDGITVPTGAAAKARDENDGTLFFRKVGAAGGGTFHQLIGNVAQFLCDAPEAFDAWQDKNTPAGIRRFLDENPNSLYVIGGSALSPPDVPLQTPLPVTHTDVGYSDVGLRLAFTAPAHSPAERLRWALADQSYFWPKPPTTEPAAGATAAGR